MPTEAILSGTISADGVLEVLRDIEARRITGCIVFTGPSSDDSMETGEVELYAGQIALDQDPLPDGSDPVERLLALRAGTFTVHQRLPPLAISQGDERTRYGSLEVHVPADLMNYCEQGGLTGTLCLLRNDERVELVYEAGELLAIRVDGEEDADVSHAFGWNEGSFRIEVNDAARGLVPNANEPEDSEPPLAREPTMQFVKPRREDTGQFIKVVEVALATIVESRERARPSSKPGTARSSTKSVRPKQQPAVVASRSKKEREPTVRVVYLKPDDPTTAVRPRENDGSVPPKPAIAPSRERATSEALSTTKQASVPTREPDRPMEHAAFAWTLTVMTLAVLFVGLLERLSWPD